MWPLLWVQIVKQNPEQGFPNCISPYLLIVDGTIPVAKHRDDSSQMTSQPHPRQCGFVAAMLPQAASPET